jgi:copper chaperone CopZ
MEITYHVPEMHCGACEASIRKALDPVDGIQKVEVDLHQRHVTVQFDEERLGPVDVKARIERAGFDVG